MGRLKDLLAADLQVFRGVRRTTLQIAVPARSWSEPRLTNRLEPAKVRGDDGRVKLRGVQEKSDRTRYLKDVDPYSNKNWETRHKYKTMRSSQHAATASKAW